MQVSLKFKINDKIYLKDPDSSELGKEIIKQSISLIADIGFEAFTFKKLAAKIETTEASMYRYFENKHKLLLYILNLYWSYLEYILTYNLNYATAKEKLDVIISILCNGLTEIPDGNEIDKTQLQEIVITEGSKSYLVKEVNEINREKMFQPYKDLCEKIASIIKEYNPNYQFSHSMASTLVETAFTQQYFKDHLPRLTDATKASNKNYIELFIKDMIYKILT